MDTFAKVKEIMAVLFCVLFCWLFLDKFLFRGELTEICFGRPRRKAAAWLRRVAGGVDMPAPQKPEVSPETPEPEKNGDLVPKHSYAIGQILSTAATRFQGEQSAVNANTFASPAFPEAQPTPLPAMFTDRSRIEWQDQDDRQQPRTMVKVSLPVHDTAEETDGPQDDIAALGCSNSDAQDGGQGIGPQELDWIIALCNGQSIPADKREAIVRAIRNIRGTQIHRSLMESINGSDNRIATFLDEAEREAAANDDNANAASGGFDMKRIV